MHYTSIMKAPNFSQGPLDSTYSKTYLSIRDKPCIERSDNARSTYNILAYKYYQFQDNNPTRRTSIQRFACRSGSLFGTILKQIWADMVAIQTKADIPLVQSQDEWNSRLKHEGPWLGAHGSHEVVVGPQLADIQNARGGRTTVLHQSSASDTSSVPESSSKYESS